MPYISQSRRQALARNSTPRNPGELTYTLTCVVNQYLDYDHKGEAYGASEGPRFHDYAEVIGALEAAKLELYRRRVTLYEDDKCRENGDVY